MSKKEDSESELDDVGMFPNGSVPNRFEIELRIFDFLLMELMVPLVIMKPNPQAQHLLTPSIQDTREVSAHLRMTFEEEI